MRGKEEEIKYHVVNSTVHDKKCYAELEKIIDGVVKDLEEKDIDEILETALDITREQSLINGKWETNKYTMCLAWGGPGTWLSTDGVIECSWWGDWIKAKIDSKRALERLEEIEQYLNDLYP